MQRVLVIGPSGAGKSTLARRIGAAAGLPVVHSDQLYFSPGWVEMERTRWEALLEEVAAGERWVIDGNYPRTLPARLARADTVFWLDFPTPLCLWRAMRRLATSYGRVRPDAAPGCPERFDPEFVRWILRWRATQRPLIEAALAGYAGRLLVFRRPVEVEEFFAAATAPDPSTSAARS
jgi:adenylate kinase family enzyme